MAAIRLIQKPENGKLIITVPDDMRDETMIIELWPAHEEQDRGSVMHTRKGRLQDRTYPTDKYDVYNQ